MTEAVDDLDEKAAKWGRILAIANTMDASDLRVAKVITTASLELGRLNREIASRINRSEIRHVVKEKQRLDKELQETQDAVYILENVINDMTAVDYREGWTKLESKLFSILIHAKGRAVSLRGLMLGVYGTLEADWPRPQTLAVHIHRVRTKLATDNATVRISNVHGVGYVLNDAQ